MKSPSCRLGRLTEAQTRSFPGGLRSLRSALGQRWGLDVAHGYLPRQRIHPALNRFHLRVAELCATLIRRHVADRLVERRNRTIMEVGTCLLDVSQRGNLEDHLVVFVFSDLIETGVCLVGPRFHHAQLLKRGAADIWPTMAPLASDGGEGVESGFFTVGKG